MRSQHPATFEHSRTPRLRRHDNSQSQDLQDIKEQVYVIDKGPHPLTKHHFKSVVSAVQVQGSPACVVPDDS